MPARRWICLSSGRISPISSRLQQRCVIAYRVADNTAIALGDPVGPEAEIGATVREFLEMCHENGWAAAFYQTLPDFLPVYRRLGLKKLKIGDDAMVDLPDFSLQGKVKTRASVQGPPA